MEKDRPLIILTGPTAVGKTELSLQLAKLCGGEIISADSMQVYRKMDIGTAKIRPGQMQGIRHYMIDVFEPDEEFNVYIFQKMAKKHMADIYRRGKVPILVGGTGFYLQAVLYDIDFSGEKQDGSYRRELQEIERERGRAALHEMLAGVDPASAGAIHRNNVKRVMRALEYYHCTGERISEHNERQKKRKPPYRFAYFVLNMERGALYGRIDRRVDGMMAAGLEDEVRSLLGAGYGRNLTSMQGLGYKEIAAAIYGECSMEDAVGTLKKNTRHFAKRQLTWFRRESGVTWIDKGGFSSQGELAEEMVSSLREKGVIL